MMFIASLRSRRALKEWAVVVEALRAGRQTFLLRKGGIQEPHGEFQAAAGEFFLFPTFEHQRADLLKAEEARRYARVLEEPRGDTGPVRIDAFARMEEAFELREPERSRLLEPLHIWSEDYIRMRIEYRPEKPLQVLLLRVFGLREAMEVPRAPRYAGCRSWVELDEDLSVEGAEPALDAAAFARQAEAVRAAVG